MGPGFWKCNVDVLKDTYFQTDFIRLWEKMENIVDQNLQWWEECKVSFKKTYNSPFLPFIAYSERETEGSPFEAQ